MSGQDRSSSAPPEHSGWDSLPPGALEALMSDVLSRGAAFRFAARGFSMTPFIRDGDIVTVIPRAGRRIGRGDVVALVAPDDGRLLVHRVVGRRGEEVLVKGDNLPRPDGWFGEAEAAGIVARVERRGRRFRLGLGPERVLVVLFSRARLPVWRLVARLRRVILRPEGRAADE